MPCVDAISLARQPCRDIILSRKWVATGPRDLGTSGDDRLDQDRRLLGDMQAPRHSLTCKGLGPLSFLAQNRQDGHS